MNGLSSLRRTVCIPERILVVRMPQQDCSAVRQADMAQAGMTRAQTNMVKTQANPFREQAGTATAWVSIHRAQASMVRAQASMIRAQAGIPGRWPMARWARSKIREDIPTAAVRIYPITDADRFRFRLRKILSRTDLTLKGREADQEDQEDREDQENREDREDPAAVSRSLRFWQACFLRSHWRSSSYSLFRS